MALSYLPILARRSAPKPARELRRIAKLAWHPLSRALPEMRIALITSGAIREGNQHPFPPLGDASYRMVTSDPTFTDLHVDHRTRFGLPAGKDPEVAFPRLAMKTLTEHGLIGGIPPFHFSVYGGIRDYRGLESMLAPELATQLAEERVELAVFLPF
jgi:hypothetical protein